MFPWKRLRATLQFFFPIANELWLWVKGGYRDGRNKFLLIKKTQSDFFFFLLQNKKAGDEFPPYDSIWTNVTSGQQVEPKDKEKKLHSLQALCQQNITTTSASTTHSSKTTGREIEHLVSVKRIQNNEAVR